MKHTPVLLTALLLSLLLAMPAHSLAEEGSVSIQVGEAGGESGETVDLPVLLGACAGVDSVQFDLNYDSAALEFVSMTPGDLFAAEYTVINADVPGRIRVACAGALGLEGAGTLMTLRFRLLSDAGSVVSITSGIVTRVDADYRQSAAYVTISDGGVTAGGAPLPQAVVTPWVPATPEPTPTPEPTATATPSPAATENPAPQTAASLAKSLPAAAYYVGGGLLGAIAVLAVILVLLRKKRRG